MGSSYPRLDSKSVGIDPGLLGGGGGGGGGGPNRFQRWQQFQIWTSGPIWMTAIVASDTHRPPMAIFKLKLHLVGESQSTH